MMKQELTDTLVQLLSLALRLESEVQDNTPRQSPGSPMRIPVSGREKVSSIIIN